MPGGDGRGPYGDGLGRGAKKMRQNQSVVGAVGECVCPNCGNKIPHKRAVPCNQIVCPNCGIKMIRK